MKKVLVACLLFAFASPAASALGAAPDNDSSSTPTEIAALPFTTTQDTTNATVGPEDVSTCNSSSPSGHSVWFRYTPQRDEVLLVDTFGSTFDTTLQAFDGPPQPYLNAIGCNDDASPATRQSGLYLYAYSGATIYIRAAGYLNEAGSLTLSVSNGANISGRVTDEAGTPLSGICVSGSSDDGTINGLGFAETDATGNYLIEGLDPGHYRIDFYDCYTGLYREEYYNDKPTYEEADVVAVGRDEAITGIDASLAGAAARPVSDLSVDDIAVTNVPVHTDGRKLPIGWVRDVNVTWSNIGDATVDRMSLIVTACPKTGGGCSWVGGYSEFGVQPGANRTESFEWNGATTFGDVDIVASICGGSESDYSNNTRTEPAYAWVGGTGFGVSLPIHSAPISGPCGVY